jgi:putative tryptophan/tyrosine transport system substrate-binding protein
LKPLHLAFFLNLDKYAVSKQWLVMLRHALALWCVAIVFSATSLLATPTNAQQTAIPIVGFLTSGPAASLNQRWFAAFERGLSEGGYANGRTVRIEVRAADDHYERLEGLVQELIDNRASVIIAAGGPVSAVAAKKVTSSIPIVFTTISDPVKSGLVASFNRPGGNVTGNAGLTSELDPKRLEILKELMPDAKVIGALINPNRPGVNVQTTNLEATAKNIGLELFIQSAANERAIDEAFELFAQRPIDALIVTADPLFNFHRAQVIALANRHSIPAIYQWRDMVEAGGLISYGPSISDAYYETGVYAAKILKGAHPSELPVKQPTKFELAINLNVAKKQNVRIPTSLLVSATNLIE